MLVTKLSACLPRRTSIMCPFCPGAHCFSSRKLPPPPPSIPPFPLLPELKSFSSRPLLSSSFHLTFLTSMPARTPRQFPPNPPKFMGSSRSLKEVPRPHSIRGFFRLIYLQGHPLARDALMSIFPFAPGQEKGSTKTRISCRTPFHPVPS